MAREIARREKTGDVETANEFRSSLGDFTKQVQGGLVNNLGEPELHHVGVYEGMLPGNAKRGFQQHPEGIVEVKLDYTGGPIILALSAYEPVLWKVKLAEGVDLRRVVLAGSKQRVEGLPDRVKVQREHQGRKLGYLGYARNDGETPYGRTINLLRKVTGVPPASFLGTYGYKGNPFVIGVSNSDWTQQVLEHRFSNTLARALEFERERKRKEYQVIRFQGPYQGESSVEREHFHDDAPSTGQFSHRQVQSLHHCVL